MMNKRGQGGNWKPLLYTLIGLAIISIILNLTYEGFNETIPAPVGIVGTGIYILQTTQNFSISLPLVPPIHPFDLFGIGTFITDYAVDQISILSVLPTILSAPIIVIGLLALIYGIVKLILP